MNYLWYALAALTVLTVISVWVKEKGEVFKYILFGAMILVILSYTGYLVWSTISVNAASVTKGPVHYHADIQIWNCGDEVDLADPKNFLDNKIGTPLFHEHNDNRIHVEGPVLDYKDITLGNFFKVVGGDFQGGALTVPANNGLVRMDQSGMCNGQPASLQVFVFKTEGNTFSQQKLENPSDYVLSPHSKIPPGDCIIFEFDSNKDKTDKICTFYKVAIEKGELSER